MIVLDTDALIQFVRGDPAVTEFVEHHDKAGHDFGTTAVNAGEFLRGAMDPRHGPEGPRAARKLLDSLVVLPFTRACSERFAEIMSTLDRAGAAIPVVDGLIASIVTYNDAEFATFNVRHFERVPRLRLRPIQ